MKDKINVTINVITRHPPVFYGRLVFYVDTDSGELYRVLEYDIYKKLILGNHKVSYIDTPDGIRTIMEIL